MAKNNIRSMRFSDRMIEIITQKFEALATRCMWELPAVRKGERADGLKLQKPTRSATAEYSRRPAVIFAQHGRKAAVGSLDEGQGNGD